MSARNVGERKMSEAKHILLVDDERLPMAYYTRALEKAGMTVLHVRNPDEAFQAISERKAPFYAIVIDIMMPPGTVYLGRDTNEGLITGVLLCKDLCERCPGMPIVVLTNVSNKDTLELLPLSKNLEVVQKLDMPPSELPTLIDKMAADLKPAG